MDKPSHRTIVELKVLWGRVCAGRGRASHRTIVELKGLFFTYTALTPGSSHRTIVELKESFYLLSPVLFHALPSHHSGIERGLQKHYHLLQLIASHRTIVELKGANGEGVRDDSMPSHRTIVELKVVVSAKFSANQ